MRSCSAPNQCCGFCVRAETKLGAYRPAGQGAVQPRRHHLPHHRSLWDPTCSAELRRRPPVRSHTGTRGRYRAAPDYSLWRPDCYKVVNPGSWSVKGLDASYLPCCPCGRETPDMSAEPLSSPRLSSSTLTESASVNCMLR